VGMTEHSAKRMGYGAKEFGRGTRRRPIERDYTAAKDAEGGRQRIITEFGRWNAECGMRKI